MFLQHIQHVVCIGIAFELTQHIAIVPVQLLVGI